MPRPTPPHLRLFSEQPAPPSAPAAAGALLDVCLAFERATGWPLRYVPDRIDETDHDLLWSAPVNPGVGDSPGHLRIDLGGPDPQAGGARVDLDLAGELAGGIAALASELLQARAALREREAELATGVPVIESLGAPSRLADRLEGVLRGGAEAVGCQAAAIYLLDSATTELKLRAAWGLPPDRLAQPARRLRDATADLEALSGHAIVMKNRQVRDAWHAPEESAAAVCVPISTAAIPLGTLWLFAGSERDFSDAEVNLVEIVAGRLASDLEREVLLSEGLEGAQLKRQVAEAERLQENQLPRTAPAADPFEVEGWTLRGDRLGGDFFDWFPHGEGGLAIALGSASGQGIAAAVLSGVLHTAIRARAELAREPQQLLEYANRALWQAASGLQTADLFYALLDPTGRIRFATAGDPGVALVRAAGWQLLDAQSLSLARDPQSRYRPCLHQLRAGELLLVTSAGLKRASESAAAAFDLPSAARWLAEHRGETLPDLALALRRQASAQSGVAKFDRTLLLIRRRPGGR